MSKKLVIRLQCWWTGHKLCIRSGEECYSCLICGRDQFKRGEKIAVGYTPTFGFGDSGYKFVWDAGKFRVMHGLEGLNHPPETTIIARESA